MLRDRVLGLCLNRGWRISKFLNSPLKLFLDLLHWNQRSEKGAPPESASDKQILNTGEADTTFTAVSESTKKTPHFVSSFLLSILATQLISFSKTRRL